MIDKLEAQYRAAFSVRENYFSFLREQTREDGKDAFKFIDVNGMKLTSPNQVYSEIWYRLKGTQLGTDAALSALEHMFLRESPKGECENKLGD